MLKIPIYFSFFILSVLTACGKGGRHLPVPVDSTPPTGTTQRPTNAPTVESPNTPNTTPSAGVTTPTKPQAQPAPQPPAPQPPVSSNGFDPEIKAIFQNRCTLCHTGTNLPDWTIYKNAFANRAEIQRRVGSPGTPYEMPPGNATGVTPSERQQIINWVQQGGNP